ncbi:Rho GTPase-activating protein 32, partial [Tupaia chinensis]
RKMKSSVHSEEDDLVPELHRNVHPRERPDWEEALSAMARGADVPEIPGDLTLKTCSSTASMKVKHVKKLPFTKGHFPKMAECAHFHYENVEFGSIQGHFPKMAECAHFHYENVEFGSIQSQPGFPRPDLEGSRRARGSPGSLWGLLSLTFSRPPASRVPTVLQPSLPLVCPPSALASTCGTSLWVDASSTAKCSLSLGLASEVSLQSCKAWLPPPPAVTVLSLSEEQSEITKNGCESKELVYLVQVACQSVTQMLTAYLARLSAIAGNKINCGPALTWMEIDNKGNHLLVHEESSINTPAVGAAHVIKRYTARAPDELTLEVGDIVSVIDMPPKVLSTWWRGKHGFQVGLFPGHCVELINQKVPQSVTNSVPKPVSKKHGKLITFLRTFMKSRPTKQKLKQRGILKERVFGCDLGEHLLNSGFEVPQVLQSCTAFIEKYGIVDGIYRLSGVASNIQRLRHEFDSEHVPDLTKEPYVQDIHSVGSLCKLYFRELPNPLLTYQLYEKFSDAVSAATDEERLMKIHDVIQQLPPPHYRTLEFLMRHLSLLADYCSITNMHAKNLAIVWAPNLLRSKQIESACFSGTAAFMEVRIQSVVVEFILNHVDVLFSGKISAVLQEGAASLSRPKSLMVSSPSTKLLTLEEAQARTQAQANSPVVTENRYIEVGEGPAALQGKFHTIIEFPLERKRPQNKMKKSPVGSWRSFFNLGKSSSVSKRKLQRNESEPSEMKALAMKGRCSARARCLLQALLAGVRHRPCREKELQTLPLPPKSGGRAEGTLRSAKSEESLTSLHAVDGDSKLFRPRRPRSSSDALSASFSGDVLGTRCNSYDNLPCEHKSEDGLSHVPVLLSPHCTEDVDLSPPDIGVASLDFDPMSFQCSPPKAESECLEGGASFLDSFSYSREKPSAGKKDGEAGGSQSQTPGSTASSEPVSPVQEKLSPFFTLDLSPTEEQSSKPCSLTEKVVCAFSPKIGRKLTKSPSLNISEPISVTLPPRVSEAIGVVTNPAAQNTAPPAWDRDAEDSAGTSRSPTQVAKVKTSDREAQEGCEPTGQAPDQAASGETELPGQEERPDPSSQSKAVGPGQTQTGAVTHDPPQDPVPVSSVSLIPPPPPPKSVARMLALALAESAQQASTQSLKRPGAAQAGHTHYGDVAMATAGDKPPAAYCSVALDQAYFQTDRPAEQVPHQNSAPGGWDQPLPETTAAGDQARANATEPGEQQHHVDLPGGQPPRPCLSGDQEKARVTFAPLTDSEKPGDHARGPADHPGKASVLPVTFAAQDQALLRFCSGDQPPPQLGASTEKPRHLPELADRSATLPRDKTHRHAGSLEENASTAAMAYVTATPVTAGISIREATWDVVGQASTADVTAATLQRTHRTNRPLPAPPPQRPAEQLPAVGPGPATACMGFSNAHKVPATVPAPERPPEPRVLEDPGPVFVGDTCAPAQGPVAAPALQPGLPEKVRDGARAPPLHLRAESVPMHSCGFPAPMPPTRTMESKVAAATHSAGAEATGSDYHCFLAAASDPGDEALPGPQVQHAPQKMAYCSFARPDVTAEAFGPENCVHFGMTPSCQFRSQSVPPHHNKLEPHQVYGARSEPPTAVGPRYNTYVAPGRSVSGHYPKPCSRMEYVPPLGSSVRSACYPEDIPPYPTIRRVQSLHAPPTSMIRSVPISRTEVPPDDEAAYCPRPLYQYKPYQASQARSDYHVTQLQPYFENGRVHYRYSPYSSSPGFSYSADGALCDLDAYGTVQARPPHRPPNRDFAFYNPRLQGKTVYGYAGPAPRPRASAAGYFSGTDHNMVTMPPAADVKHSYASWDLEDVDKYRMQSLRRESRARQKVKGPVPSQYDNMVPAVQDDLGGIYVIHLRSKSDPGKTGLLSVAEGKEGRHPAKALSPEADDRFYRKHLEPEFDRARPRQPRWRAAREAGPPAEAEQPEEQEAARHGLRARRAQGTPGRKPSALL